MFRAHELTAVEPRPCQEEAPVVSGVGHGLRAHRLVVNDRTRLVSLGVGERLLDRTTVVARIDLGRLMHIERGRGEVDRWRQLRTGFGEQLAQLRLDIGVPAFPGVVEGDVPVLVDEIDMRPGIVVIRVPRPHHVVDGDGVRQAIALDRSLDVVDVLLEAELG